MRIRTVIHQRRNDLSFWPLRFRIELLCKPIPPALIRYCDLSEIIVQYRLVEVYDELWNTVSPMGSVAGYIELSIRVLLHPGLVLRQLAVQLAAVRRAVSRHLSEVALCR